MDQVWNQEKSLTYLNPVLAKTNEEIDVTSSASQTSFVNDVEESEGDESPNE